MKICYIELFILYILSHDYTFFVLLNVFCFSCWELWETTCIYAVFIVNFVRFHVCFFTFGSAVVSFISFHLQEFSEDVTMLSHQVLKLFIK